MEYKKLLEQARKELPKSVFEKERFEIPKVRGHIQGNRTVISNFLQIANSVGREPEHMLKFVLRELAAPGEIKKSGDSTSVPCFVFLNLKKIVERGLLGRI